MFYNNHYISKYVIHIIKSNVGEYVSYGSRFQAIYLVEYNYTFPRTVKRDYVTPIQGPVLKYDKQFH